MKLTKNEKIEKAKELADVLKQAPHLFFTDYKGMKFGEIDELRNKLRPLRCKYAVVKNSLVKYALKNAGVDGGVDPKLLEGPIGMIVANDDDPVAPAKVLAALTKQFPNLKIKAGYVSSKWVTPADVQKLSTIASKPELLAKMVGGLYAAVAQSAGVLQAPIRDMVLVLKALEDKKKAEAK